MQNLKLVEATLQNCREKTSYLNFTVKRTDKKIKL